ncbi:hypothetical protein THITH_04205 [Thioalkalivibrio paradoxus ARh 1]|uniref:Uncharacterized protein n=1 Tax=Thioalkalivibrio paradoxus ARh 1 TaxID=713585 RepID=W0DMW2_9GAMM|nr:hypothetical protein THITH_04205 [Thioalkalivibrio paradoxus ARh 1]
MKLVSRFARQSVGSDFFSLQTVDIPGRSGAEL